MVTEVNLPASGIEGGPAGVNVEPETMLEKAVKVAANS
jgi:hypothetical protein